MNRIGYTGPLSIYNRKLLNNTRHLVHMNSWHQPCNYAGHAAEQREQDYCKQEFQSPH